MKLFLFAVFLGWATIASSFAHAKSPVFSDAELIDGFMKTVFGSENFWISSKAKNRVSKFLGPVNVHIVDLAGSRNGSTVRRFIGDLNRRVRPLSISATRSEARANYQVFLVRRADYTPIIRQTLPDVRTKFLERAACSGIAFLSPDGAITNAIAFVVIDEGEHLFRHCMVEEILQGLGPSNDSPDLKYSIFNDRNATQQFTPFDRYIMNMLYDPRIKPGMKRRDVKKVLPAIVRDVRKRLGSI